MILPRSILSLAFSLCFLTGLLSAEEPLSITRGAIPITFEMPVDGTASLGIYTEGGQLKRVLFQAVEISQGTHTVSWDGMDLWGKLIEPGTRLKAKVFTHQGIRAFYEFPLGYGDWYKEDPPWRTAITFPDRKDGEILGPNGKPVAYRKDGVTYRMTKGMFDQDGNLTDKAKKAAYRHLSGDRVVIQPGEATLRGGWMSDHNPPKAIEVVGDRVFVSASGAEAGDPFIALNAEGRKIWGKGGAMGGKGPSRMWALSDSEMLLLEGNRLSRFNTLDFTRSHFLTLKDPIQNIDVSGERIHVIHKPRSAVKVEHFHKTLSRNPIQYANTVPLHLSDEAGHMSISARDNFTQVFTGGSHALLGIGATYHKGLGYIIVPLRSPGKVGSLAVGPYSKSGLKLEVYLLKSGLKYDPETHSPKGGHRGQVADLGSLGDMGDFNFGGEELSLDIDEVSRDWELFGSTDGKEALNWIVGKNPPRETNAVMLKFVLPKGKMKGDVLLKHCVFWQDRIQVAPDPKIQVHKGSLKKGAPPSVGNGWWFRSTEQIEPARPFQMMLDYREPISFEGFLLKQNRNHDFIVEAWRGEEEPSLEKDSLWEEVYRYRVGPSHRTGYGTQKDNLLQTVSLTHREETRALRLTYRSGLGRGKNGVRWRSSDPHLVAIQDFTPLRLKDKQVKAAEDREPYDYVQYDLHSGKEVARHVTFDATFREFTVHDDGQIFGTLNLGRHNRPLVKSRLEGDNWIHTRFKPDEGPETYQAVRSSKGRLLVSGGHRIFVMDPGSMKTLHTLGWDQDYAPGPFDRNMVGRGGSDMAMDDLDKVWFIESRRQPKRVARFNLQGECEWHLTGGPGYGGFGTGYIDPDLENFYTNGLHYNLDYDAGTSDLIGFSDVPYAESSPIVVNSVFNYTTGGRVIHHENGHKYAVGYNSEFVALLKNGVMQPCMVAGWATAKGGSPSRFFTHKAWKEEWVGVDLKGKRYFWNDRNADGRFQKEEVILYRVDRETGIYPTVSGAYWGQKMGKDLALNTGTGRLAPTSFSQDGVPRYDLENFQRFAYRDLPSYSGLQAWGSRACGNPNPHNGQSIVTDSGHRIMVGQPYVWDQNLEAVGGVPDTEGGGDGFRPEVPGGKIEHPNGYAGVGTTRSEAGEVAAVIGNLGTWSIVSAHDRILLANILDGQEGEFSTDLSGARGTEVSHRRFESESYFGHFVTTTDGRHFIAGGKNYHALIRLEGLDEIKVTEIPVRISPAQYAKNQGLRSLFVQEWKEQQQARQTGRWLVAKTTRDRLGQDKPRIDGSIDSWGGIKKMHPIDARLKSTDPEPRYYFDVARSSRGLHLVYAGKNFQGSANETLEGIFKDGFAFDFRWRSDRDARRRKEVVAGDRRIVFGKLKGEWTAVLHDYIVPGAKKSDGRSYSSPVVTTWIDVVRELQPDEYELKVQEETLMMTSHFNGLDPEGNREEDPRKWWTAEVILPWKLLGISHPMQFDVGVMAANSGGTGVAERRYWATPQSVKATSDLGAEAAIHPDKWGRMFFDQPEGAELERVNSRWTQE